VAYDQMRGQVPRMLIISHITPNIPPFIDSIQIRTTMLKASSMVHGIYRVGFPAFDTLRMRLFTHDSSGSVRSAVWSAKENDPTVDSANSMRAVYVCPTEDCLDTLQDSSVVVDTITVTVFDNRGDSTVRAVELSKGTINQPPLVRSILFDNRGVVFTDTAATVAAPGGAVYLLKLNAEDPEGRALTVTWSGSPSSRLTEKTDSTARYGAPAANDTDTVRVTVSDGMLTVSRMLRIIVDDVIPVFDSIIVDDTVFKGNDSFFSLTVTPRDTLFFLAYARDRDTADSMTFAWTSGNQDRFSIRIQNRARYVLPDSSLNDTIILTLQDGDVQVVRKIVLMPENRAPIVDSILRDDVLLEMNNGSCRDTALAGDTVNYRVVAHDPEGENLTGTWRAADTTRLFARSGLAADYFCGDSSYVDTLSITVRDESEAGVTRKILVQVDTVATP
ncbi:MAG: hypothetical protein JW913_17845, partial [Chitinispirillaceae bacterium]|nr:hypothetical protein [Chitinispirillaceae bacterium]